MDAEKIEDVDQEEDAEKIEDVDQEDFMAHTEVWATDMVDILTLAMEVAEDVADLDVAMNVDMAMAMVIN